MTLTLSHFEKRWGPVYLLLQLFLVPYGAALLCVALSIDSVAAANLLGFSVNAVLAVVFFRQLLRSSLKNFRWGRTLRTAGAGFCLYWLANTVLMTAILALKPDFANINDTGINAMIDEFPVLMPLAVVFAAPLSEECLFRGWIFTGLTRKSLPLAYTVTTLTFSLIHTLGYIGTCDAMTLALCTMQYLVPAAVLCWVCHKSDSLLVPLLLHMAINTIALFTTR
jgi:membrane protease YdiL (CAAX protease family)